VELYFHSPSTSSWRGTYLSTGTTLPLPSYLPPVFLFLSSFPSSLIRFFHSFYVISFPPFHFFVSLNFTKRDLFRSCRLRLLTEDTLGKALFTTHTITTSLSRKLAAPSVYTVSGLPNVTSLCYCYEPKSSRSAVSFSS